MSDSNTTVTAPSSTSTHLLLTLACNSSLEGEYNLPLHIGSVFIIMALCICGMLVPILTKRMPKTVASHLFFCAAKMFGTGVILATSIVHMFLPAVLLLANPCLPDIWINGYPAFAAVFFLAGILGTHLLQVVLTSRMSKPSTKPVQLATTDDIETASLTKGTARTSMEINSSTGTCSNPIPSCCQQECPSPIECQDEHVEHHMDLGILDTDDHCHRDSVHVHRIQTSHDTTVTIPDDHTHEHTHNCNHEHSHDQGNSHDHGHSHGLSLLKERQLSVYLLEIGIFSHSVLIGVTLGTARAEFLSLLIALCFHQFFEGMALSAVLVESSSQQGKFKLLNFLYCLTTPIGICIGISARLLYNDNGVTSILVQGILDSISGGILIYDGLINIVSPHFKSLDFVRSNTSHQMVHIGALWLGTSIMAFIGKYA